jgi:hypothetical protein
MEVDLYPRFRPELAADLEGSLGELSLFHQTYGYHADGVEPKTATLPEGWDSRLVTVTNENTDGAIGRCLAPLDLAFSKLAAGRDKDIAFVSALLRFKMVRPSKLEELIRSVEDSGLSKRLADNLAVCQRK